MRQWLSDLPDTTRLALLTAWRGRQRGAAVFAGVFLAALVITSVLAYGNGLLQVFFEESLEVDLYDVRVDFHASPNGGHRTENTTLLYEACEKMLEHSMVEDCALAAGYMARHTTSWFDESGYRAQPLELQALTGPHSDWENVSLRIVEDDGPPTGGYRPLRFLGDGMFDGVLAQRHNDTILQGIWPANGEAAVATRALVLPWSVARMADAGVGDHIDRLNFTYSHARVKPCVGPDRVLVNLHEEEYCRVTVVLENLTIVGIYDDSIIGNPMVSMQALYLPWNLLEPADQREIIAGDHVYLALALDYDQLDTSSVGKTEEQLKELETDIEDLNYDGDLEFDAVVIIISTIDFFRIQLIFIQIFDYIIMIPIIVLSISVLIFGLLLSLEQRRREININRAMGGSAQTMQRMVRSELLVISLVAWFAGYLVAMIATRYMLSAVGFLQFSSEKVDISLMLSLKQLLFAAGVTIGLALLFGHSRTKEFLTMEIVEGVAAVRSRKPERKWLHRICFFIGLLALADSYLESVQWTEGTDFEEGIVEQMAINFLLNVFGPFLLWIGGALVLAKLGARAPALAGRLLGGTPLLRDVRRGLQSSGSSEGVSRLAVILLLTLSIITMAAIQGYTGTDVDKRTASAEVGADLRVEFLTPVNASTARNTMLGVWDPAQEGAAQPQLTALPMVIIYPDGDEYSMYQAWVVLDEAENVLHWDDQEFDGDSKATLTALRGNGFTTGEEAARGQRLGKEDSESSIGTAMSFNHTDRNGITRTRSLVWEGEHRWVPGSNFAGGEDTMLIGEASWRAFTGQGEGGELLSSTWYFEVGTLEEYENGDPLIALAQSVAGQPGVSAVANWEQAHRDVERNGGLVFGTQGLLSLQFVVASLAAVASSFVFLSLVLHQRHKELAITQAIGGTHGQVFRLVLFEILSIVVASMILGMMLGLGLAFAFNGIFNLFGIIFQIFSGNPTLISRELVWPLRELVIIAFSVLVAVVLALFITVRTALRADLSQTLKGE